MPACSSHEVTSPNTDTALSHEGGLTYSGIGSPTLEFSYSHKTKQKKDTNYRAEQPQHQNGKQPASRHFAAKLGPQQKISFVQRKMFLFFLFFVLKRL